MDLKELFSSSFEALTLNKTRTALATLGIVIGIAAVITLVSLGQAGQASVESQIQSLGSNLLTVIPGTLRPGDFRSVGGTTNSLTLADAQALTKTNRIQGIKQVSAELQRRAAVSTGKTFTNTSVIGVLPDYASIHNLQIQTGSFITSSQNNSEAHVAVIGPTTAGNLFGSGDPIGQSIRINKIAFRVIGVTVSKGGGGLGGNLDDSVYIPLSTAQKQLFGVDYIGTISIAVNNADQMNAVRDQVGYFLIARHKIQNPLNADFTIFSQEDLLATVSQVTGTFTALLSGIAAISLLVGGIGIMNIMLVTVIERTREIGLRKALGAKNKDIISQFLVESILLTLAGGILGMILGITLSYLISNLIKLPFILSPGAVILAVAVSSGIGIIFGLYPARKASQLKPIEALRYE